LLPPVSMSAFHATGLSSGVVTRRHRGDHVAQQETQPGLVAPAQLGGFEQTLGRLACRQVGLQDSFQQWIAGPGRIGEPAVFGVGSDRGPADGDLSQLGGEPGRMAGC
jgi:hypothetical protein